MDNIETEIHGLLSSFIAPFFAEILCSFQTCSRCLRRVGSPKVPTEIVMTILLCVMILPRLSGLGAGLCTQGESPVLLYGRSA